MNCSTPRIVLIAVLAGCGDNPRDVSPAREPDAEVTDARSVVDVDGGPPDARGEASDGSVEVDGGDHVARGWTERLLDVGGVPFDFTIVGDVAYWLEPDAQNRLVQLNATSLDTGMRSSELTVDESRAIGIGHAADQVYLIYTDGSLLRLENGALKLLLTLEGVTNDVYGGRDGLYVNTSLGLSLVPLPIGAEPRKVISERQSGAVSPGGAVYFAAQNQLHRYVDGITTPLGSLPSGLRHVVAAVEENDTTGYALMRKSDGGGAATVLRYSADADELEILVADTTASSQGGAALWLDRGTLYWLESGWGNDRISRLDLATRDTSVFYEPDSSFLRGGMERWRDAWVFSVERGFVLLERE